MSKGKEIWSRLRIIEIIDEACFAVVDGIGPLERLLLDNNNASLLVGVRRYDLVAFLIHMVRTMKIYSGRVFASIR